MSESTKKRNRSRARLRVLKGEGHQAASHAALSKQAKQTARERGPRERHRAAVKAVHTKGKEVMREAARKAARTRKRAA